MGSVLKSVGGLASAIPGAGSWVGPAAMLAGGLLGGGKKKSKVPGQDLMQGQRDILGMVLPFLKDPGAAVAAFGNQAHAQAAQQGASLGGLLRDTTGSPEAEAAARLHFANQATEATNNFGYQTMSPQGRAETAASILPLYAGVQNQQLQRYQLGQQYGQPTFANQLFGAASSALPWYLQNMGHGSNNVNQGHSSPGSI